MCLLICSTEYTASFVPCRQETVSKSNCPLAACLIAAGTVLLPSPSIRPGVIPSHLIAVNLGLARAQTLVNPQVSWLFGQFVINHLFLLFFVSESDITYCSSAWEVQRGSAWLPVSCVFVGTSQLCCCLSEAVKVQALELCKNKSWCWFNPITLRWSLNHWTLSRIPALIL